MIVVNSQANIGHTLLPDDQRHVHHVVGGEPPPSLGVLLEMEHAATGSLPETPPPPPPPYPVQNVALPAPALTRPPKPTFLLGTTLHKCRCKRESPYARGARAARVFRSRQKGVGSGSRPDGESHTANSGPAARPPCESQSLRSVSPEQLEPAPLKQR